MKNHFLILGLVAFMACKQADPTPDAGQIVAGTYTAKSTNSFGETKQYPINGKTILLQIDRISADTVRVRLQAPANGFFSPAKDTTYNKVYVLTNPQGYYLTLESPIHPGTAENQIALSTGVTPTSGTALYTFVPPGYTLGAVSTFFSKGD
jgi:hypothetical protein